MTKMKVVSKVGVFADAVQWINHEDHPAVISAPLLSVEWLSGGKAKVQHKNLTDEQRGELRQDSNCTHEMHEHGWLRYQTDALSLVCPGDWIVTYEIGGSYRYSPKDFHQTFRIVPTAEYMWRDAGTEPRPDIKIPTDGGYVSLRDMYGERAVTTCSVCGMERIINAECSNRCRPSSIAVTEFTESTLQVRAFSEGTITLMDEPSMTVGVDDDGKLVIVPHSDDTFTMVAGKAHVGGHDVMALRVSDVRKLLSAAEKTWEMQGANEHHGPRNRIKKALEAFDG